ncbi:MAG: c-type cytochrome [Pseudomonadota bacterium]
MSSAAERASSGDPVRGAQAFAANCGACHSLDANRVGPALRGVYGRRAGAASRYSYSPALRTSNIVWSAQTLDRWLQGPERVVPGTRMRFRLEDPNRRADVVAFLRQQGVRSPPQ